jgi:hypothetical protein
MRSTLPSPTRCSMHREGRAIRTTNAVVKKRKEKAKKAAPMRGALRGTY